MATPGLTLGPQNIDSGGELTKKLGTHNKAHILLKRHAELYPRDLTAALARPRDVIRSEGLDLDEVREALLAVRGRRAFFQDAYELEDASVRGRSVNDRIVSVVFRLPSGRSARGVLAYNEDTLPESFRRAEELGQKVASGEFYVSDSTSSLERTPGYQGGSAKVAEGDSGVSREELQQAMASVLEVRTAAEEAAKRAAAAEEEAQALREKLERAENPEPFEGYDDLKADEIIARIKEGGRDEFGRAGLERIQTYEQEQAKPRSTELSAVEDALAADSAGGES